MSVKMSLPRKILFIITVFLSNTIIMGDYIFYPAYDYYYTTFADKIGVVNFIVSGCYIALILLPPVAGKLCKSIGSKSAVLIGAILGCIGGLGFIFFGNNIYILAVCRFIFIGGYAFEQVAAIALIGDVYTDPDKNATMVGFYNAAMTGIGVIISTLAGILVAKSLSSALNMSWMYVVYVIMVIFLIPDVKTVSSEENIAEVSAEVENAKSKEKMPWRFWIEVVCYCLIALAITSMSLFASVYVSEHDLGDASLTGYLNTVNLIFSFAAGIIFGKLFEKLGNKLPIICYIIIAFVMFALWKLPSVGMLYFIYAIQGLGYATVVSYVYVYGPSLVPDSRKADALAIITTAFGIMVVISSYIITGFMGLTGSDLVTPVYGFSLAIVIIAFVLKIISLNIGVKKTA